MSNFKEEIQNIKFLLGEIENDVPKIDKGVKKASRRVRKNLSAISKACKAARQYALEEVTEG